MRRRERKALTAWEADTRRLATDTARQLALDLYHQRDRGVTPYTVGVVLDPGEVPWAECHTHFAHGSNAAAAAVPGDPTPPVYRWLVTSARVVGRLDHDRLYGWRWEHMLGCRVDLTPGGERVGLDLRDAPGPLIWSGPGVAPLAVVAIYYLHGATALVQHPGLTELRAF